MIEPKESNEPGCLHKEPDRNKNHKQTMDFDHIRPICCFRVLANMTFIKILVSYVNSILGILEINWLDGMLAGSDQ